VEPILQPLCFDIHPCNGGYVYPLGSPRDLPPVTNHQPPATLLSEPLPVRRECIGRTIGSGGPSRQTFLRPEFRCFRLRRRVRWVSSLGVGSSSSRASPFFVPTNN
jgi:hypothetical protein